MEEEEEKKRRREEEKKRGRRRREKEKEKKKEEGRREVQEFKVWILIKGICVWKYLIGTMCLECVRNCV